jgi:hypothetical protein
MILPIGSLSFAEFAYECYVLRNFLEPTKPPKDPVVQTPVFVTDDDRLARTRIIEVRQELQSGIIHKRHEQYRGYKTST